jgi:uncharacterized protein
MSAAPTVTAFAGARRIAFGALPDVVARTKAAIDDGTEAPVFIFADATGEIVEIDFRGKIETVLDRLAKRIAHDAPDTTPVAIAERRGPGRPKLGVVAREVTLLPRHWAWLGEQPGGASVALRKLVDEARRRNEEKDRSRRAANAAYRFMHAMAGDRPGFEEASRALFAGDGERFRHSIRAWPKDIREYAKQRAEDALAVDASGDV